MSGLPRGPYTVKIRATVTRIDDAEGAEGADAREAYARAMSSAALLLAA